MHLNLHPCSQRHANTRECLTRLRNHLWFGTNFSNGGRWRQSGWFRGRERGPNEELNFLKGGTGVCDQQPSLHVLQHRKLVPLLRWSLHCGIHMLTGGTCKNNPAPRFKKRGLHDDMVHKYPKNQSYVGSIGQTLTTNVSMTLCNWQFCHQTHGLCGCTAFGTELKLSTKLIRSVRLL